MTVEGESSCFLNPAAGPELADLEPGTWMQHLDFLPVLHLVSGVTDTS